MAEQPKPPAPDEADLRRRCQARIVELKADRSGYEDQWREISNLILPTRGRYIPQQQGKGKRQNARAILDPTATKAHGKLAAFLEAGITNPSLDWFRLGLGDPALDELPEVKTWSAAVEQSMLSVMAGSFYAGLRQTYEEIGGFATGAMLILPDADDVIWCYPLTVGEYYLALDKKNNCDTLIREYSLTVAQLVEEFGKENCSYQVQEMYESGRGLGTRVVVQHFIMPNTKPTQGRVDWRGRKYISAYGEVGRQESWLRLEGFSYKPFIAPRWHALAGDAYGTGPGHLALADTKTLQVLQEKYALLIAKLAEPPVMADSALQSTLLGLNPGDINWVSGLAAGQTKGMEPIYQVSPQVQGLAEKIAETQRTLQSTFYNDVIQAISEREGIQPLNEEEIAERRQEKLLLLGPVLERFYSEALAPSIRIIFDIMNKRGMFPPPPEAIRGRTIEPRFVSVLAQAQKAVGTTGLEQMMRFVGSQVPVFPEAALCLNIPVINARYADSLNVPPECLVPPEKVEEMKQAMANQQQQQQAIQNAGAIAQGAQTLSQTDVGGGVNALQAMTGR